MLPGSALDFSGFLEKQQAGDAARIAEVASPRHGNGNPRPEIYLQAGARRRRRGRRRAPQELCEIVLYTARQRNGRKRGTDKRDMPAGAGGG
jgi:hypothetical protein